MENRDDPISLKQCERIHESLDKFICTKISKVETRIDAMDKAMDLTAAQLRDFKIELSKHLDTLNHYKEQEIKDRKELLDGNIFRDYKDRVESFMSATNISLKELTLAKDRRLTLVTFLSIIAIIVTIVGTVVKVFI